jgi:ProP effector
MSFPTHRGCLKLHPQLRLLEDKAVTIPAHSDHARAGGALGGLAAPARAGRGKIAHALGFIDPNLSQNSAPTRLTSRAPRCPPAMQDHVDPVPAEDPAHAEAAGAPVPTGEGAEAPVTLTADAPAAPAAVAAPKMSLEECTHELRTRFPALFEGRPRPIKLHIQADIQARAPGVFTKAVLSAYLRRYTGARTYLLAMTREAHRRDLDGQPAGDITEEHREVARQELQRREQAFLARRQMEEDQQRDRARLLREFQSTTLTRANFCALKGVPEGALDALLERARQEAEERARAPQRPGPRDPRGPRGPQDGRGGGMRRDDRARGGPPQGERGPRGPGCPPQG